jgi:arylsulfatase A
MVHFCDWFPTILALVGVEIPRELEIDGVDVLPVLRGEGGRVETRRFWQWNRYTPLVTCNAAMRDGDWKLVRPLLLEAMWVPDLHWLWVSMYGPDYFIRHGILRDPEPEREVPSPPPAELYNIAVDPLEQENLAEEHPDRVHRMLRELETWFEEVEADRASIT